MTNTSAAVERSDSQRSQRSQGNGPRVSFNRDVHVKRIDLNPDRFHSLPSRKKHSPLTATTSTPSKPVNRSSSDVSAKSKPTKKASIFSLFSGRKAAATDPSATESAAGELQWRRVGRSRSDVGQPGGAVRPNIAGIRKRNNSESNDEPGTLNSSSSSKKKSVPLSPIIENPPRQSYFGDADLGGKAETGAIPAGNIGYTHLAELDQVPSKPAAVATDMHMHSSQQPADRLPLTKGVTVDGIVKRLSAERFSPVPNLQSPAFSYTRPNDAKIVYAQVMKDIEANGGLSGAENSTPPTRYSFQTSKTHSPEVRPVNFREKYLSDRASPVGQRASLSPPQKLYDEDCVDTAPLSQSQSHRGYEERPIIPIIRQVNYQYPEMNALSNRRQLLESRLNSRRMGASAEQLDPVPAHRPVTRTHDIRVDDQLYENQPPEFRKSAEPECPPRRRWRAKSAERDRAPYIEDCYDDPAADDVYSGPRAPHVPATKRRPAEQRVIDLGYIEDVANPTDSDNDHHSFHQNKFREQYRQEFEPQSLDSQFGEMHAHHPHPAPPLQQQRSVSPVPLQPATGQYRYADPGQTLLREQRTQRSFDRGDSGIERDYRKNSAGAADDFSNGSRTWKSMHTLYAPDDAGEVRQRTEQFLRRERQHCDRQQALRHQYAFRERSIDDGSHYDPRLDKYPVGSSATYRKYPSPTAVDYNANHMGGGCGSSGSAKSTSPPARSERTTLSGLMGLDKVKQLFTGKKKTGASATTTTMSKTTPPSPPTTLRKKEKDKRMRRGVGGGSGYEDDEATTRHSYQSSKSAKSLAAGGGSGGSGNGLSILREPKLSDIATRRRLSTPKASPQLPKRATASTLSKSSRTSGQTTTTSSLTNGGQPAQKKEPVKKAWYKSLERLTSPIMNHHQAPNYGKKRLSQSTNTLNKDSRSIGLHNDAPTRAQHHPNNHQLHHQSHQQLSTGFAPHQLLQENLSPARHHHSASTKNLRFFGDTDLDSNPPTISQGFTAGTMKRTPLASLPTRDAGSTQTLPRKYSQAAAGGGANVTGMPPTKPTRSGRKEFRSSTKHLHNISESASDVDEPDASAAGRHRTLNGHQPEQPVTTVADLRTAMKTRSRSSPVRRTEATTSGTFQRSASRHPANGEHGGEHGEHQGFNYRSSSELDQRRSRSPSAGAELNRKPPTGSQPPHLARLAAAAGSQSTLNRRAAAAAKHSRDRERALDSSGTEGDSSQHSVVYLHPPTVGAIPQPHVLRSRRAHSREELSSARSSSLTGTGFAGSSANGTMVTGTTTGTLKSRKSTASGKSAKVAKAPLQPMSRTVSRSLSLLAPWSPRHLHEGYEIDYSAQSNGQKTPPKSAQTPRHPPPAPASRSTHSRKYYSGDPQLAANGSDSDRRPTSMLRHYREQDMRRETISIPSRR